MLLSFCRYLGALGGTIPEAFLNIGPLGQQRLLPQSRRTIIVGISHDFFSLVSQTTASLDEGPPTFLERIGHTLATLSYLRFWILLLNHSSCNYYDIISITNSPTEEKFPFTNKSGYKNVSINMTRLAAHYNNLGVDILSRDREENRDDIGNTDEILSIDRDELSGEARNKRRKILQFEHKAQKEADTEQQVNEALGYFQKALSLIVQTTEDHHYYGKGFKHQHRQNNEALGKQIEGSVKSRDTNMDLKGESIYSSNEFIYWKAIKIGENNRVKNNNDENDDISCCGGDFTRALNEQEQLQQQHPHRRHDADQCYNRNPSNCTDQAHNHSYSNHQKYQRQDQEQQEHFVTGGYESLSKSIYHSMICIYNIALCYQYKGMITKARHIRMLDESVHHPHLHHHLPNSRDINSSIAAAEFFLNASVDHYTRAYELMTLFRLEDGSQYTLLMATMNNLAATYGSLEEPYKAKICNKYLVRSLILVICSSERDGHLGQEVISRSASIHSSENGGVGGGGVLSREDDRKSFEAFLSNVMHLMMGGDETTYRGDITAAAA